MHAATLAKQDKDRGSVEGAFPSKVSSIVTAGRKPREAISRIFAASRTAEVTQSVRDARLPGAPHSISISIREYFKIPNSGHSISLINTDIWARRGGSPRRVDR